MKELLLETVEDVLRLLPEQVANTQAEVAGEPLGIKHVVSNTFLPILFMLNHDKLTEADGTRIVDEFNKLSGYHVALKHEKDRWIVTHE